MQVNIDGHHVEVTEPLREYVLSKLARLERHSGGITSAHVTLVLEKNRQKAEARIHVAGGDLFAEAEQDDMVGDWRYQHFLDMALEFRSIKR